MQKGVQPGASKVYLIKWPVSVYTYTYTYTHSLYIYNKYITPVFSLSSVDVKACYTYTAYPDSYSPHISKINHIYHHNMQHKGRYTHMFECLCCSPTSALGIHFEADVERRKLGLTHRVHFLGRSLSELEYVHSVEVELRGQKHPDCQTVTFVVQVEHSFIH